MLALILIGGENVLGGVRPILGPKRPLFLFTKCSLSTRVDDFFLNSQDTSLGSTSMTMIITVVPPVGPPIPTIVGKAIKIDQDQDYQVYLDEKLDRDGVYFETEDLTMIFPNGTIIYQYVLKSYL